MSIPRVVAEVKRNAIDLGVRNIGFYDSIFPLRRDYGESLYREMEQEKLIGKARFFIETRVDLVWKETFRWLKKAGTHLVFLGIESANEDLLKAQDKPQTTREIREAVQTLHDVGLRTYGLFMIGLPDETAEDRTRLKTLACELPLDVASFGLYTPYAGSAGSRSIEGVDPLMFTRSNHDKEHPLAQDQRDLMRAFYLRPKLIFQYLRRRELNLNRMLTGAWTLFR